MDFLNLDSYSVNLINDYFKYDLDNYNSTFIKAKISELSYFQQLFILLNILENPTQDLDINLSLITGWKIDTKDTNLHEIDFAYGELFQADDKFFRQEIYETRKKEAQNIAFSKLVSRSFQHFDKYDRLIEIYIFAEKVEQKYSSLFKSIINHLEKLHISYFGSNKYYTSLYNKPNAGSIYSTLTDSLHYMDWCFRATVLDGFDLVINKLSFNIFKSIMPKNNFSDKEKFVLPLLLSPKSYQNAIYYTGDFKNLKYSDLSSYLDSLKDLCYRFSGKEFFEDEAVLFPDLSDVCLRNGGQYVEYLDSRHYSDSLFDLINPEKNEVLYQLKFQKQINKDLLLKILKTFFDQYPEKNLNSDNNIRLFIDSIYYDKESISQVSGIQSRSVVDKQLILPSNYAHDFIRVFLFLHEKSLILENKTKILTVLSEKLKQPNKRNGLGLRTLKKIFKDVKIKERSKIEFDYDNIQKAKNNSNFNRVRASINSVLIV